MTGVLLSEANDSLEEKVKTRTLELSEALSRLEENQVALMQAAKMSALGEMAGGVAHEVNTPLGAIMLNTEMLISTAKENYQDEMLPGLEAIVQIVSRISKIINGLRRFSRDSTKDQMTEVKVGDIIADTLTLCQERFKANNIELRKNYSLESPLSVSCVSEQISQILINLLNNSLDVARDLEPGSRWIDLQILETREVVEISVTDGGLGIPDSIQQKMMQPFFTTKEIGKGTGLGLSISRGIAEKHGEN